MPAARTSSRKAAVLSRLRLALLGLLLASWSTASLAVDPLVRFLLKMNRDQAITATLEAGYEAALEQYRDRQAVAPGPQLSLAPPLPGSANEEARLKALIDEGFTHLTSGQRAELLASLMKIVNDPVNASRRATLIAEFTQQANALRDAHRMLSRMSEADMKVVVSEARNEYARLPPDQQREMLQVLRRGIPGVPDALNEMMLVEFSSVGG